MAGEAPSTEPSGNRVLRWVDELSNLRISLYMLLIATALAGMLLALDQHLRG